MKTVIGFVCGIVGMVLTVLTFLTGFICGVVINEDMGGEEAKQARYRNYNRATKYTDWAKQNKED